ncbi:hypothetical protein [Nocardia sp. NPDC052566]|uniref:hypothetical protein n=1 Tax=Nocardia sp. NPDC052566 TaxID=3364330 RepID=UPI0037C57D3E
MITSFPPVGQCMDDALKRLTRSRDIDASNSGENAIRITLFADAMTALVGVHIGMSAGFAPSSSELDSFRFKVAALVQANSRSLFSYVHRSVDSAIRSRVDGWYDPCLRRSAIQILLDEFPGAADAFDQEDRESIEEMDEWLRDRAPDILSLPERIIPTGLPASHWWWRLPAANL